MTLLVRSSVKLTSSLSCPGSPFRKSIDAYFFFWDREYYYIVQVGYLVTKKQCHLQENTHSNNRTLKHGSHLEPCCCLHESLLWRWSATVLEIGKCCLRSSNHWQDLNTCRSSWEKKELTGTHSLGNGSGNF